MLCWAHLYTQQAKESISELEDRLKDIAQTETQRQKRLKREQSIQKLWDNISQLNKDRIVMSEGEERKN